MAEISIRLAVEGRDRVSRGLRDTAADVERVDSRLSRVSRSALDAARGLGGLTGRGIASGIRATATGVTALAAGLGTLATAGAAVGLKTAADMEQAQIAFTTMLGSGERAQAFLRDLNQFAAKTPFDFPGLQTAASSLISAGIDASKVIPIMTSLGNATSGMGTGAEGVQRATVALQQMNAAGKISGEDLNQLRDAGIPVFDLLTAATGKTTEQIADMASKGKLGRQELEQLMSALESGKGLEKFNGLMEAQSNSLSGMVSTFKDTVGMGLAQAMQPAIPLVKTILGDANQLLANILPGVISGVGKVTAAIGGAYEIFVRGDFDSGWWGQLGVAEDSGVIDTLFKIRESAQGLFSILFQGDYTTPIWGQLEDSDVVGILFSIREAAMNLPAVFDQVRAALAGVDFSRIGEALRSFGQAAGDSSAPMDALKVTASALGTVLGFVSQHADTLIRYMPLIVGGLIAWKAAQQAQLLISVAGIPWRATELAATFAQARANAALALQLQVLTGVQRQSMLSRILATGATIASTTATLAASAASRVAAAGQWLLNAALTANPIGLVVAGIAALVAGLVWFFTKTEVGRRAWDSLTGAFRSAIDWIKGTAVPVIKAGFAAAVQIAKDKFDSISGAIGGFVGKLRDAWDWVKKLGDRLSNSAIGQAIGSVSSGISGLFGGARAEGGPVRRGVPYLVGEQGAEFFVPGASGQITSHENLLRAVAPTTIDPGPLALAGEDYDLPSGEQLPARRIEVPVILDGREIARAVYDDAKRQMARA
ncbi:tape measure protein [Kineococcus terrestris]|uniref:tape measure protein n=1 Tax=Kineococcus terrestris TaxID=2044856 RepID=UPI0034DAFF96